MEVFGEPGKRPTITPIGRDVMDPKCNRPSNFKFSDDDGPKVRQLEREIGTSENGFYTIGRIENQEVNFLVDSGSTVTLLSGETFERCGGKDNIPLYQRDVCIQGVDNTKIKVHGYADIILQLGEFQTEITIVVCDISLEGILGQDFITKHIRYWDLESLQLWTKNGSSISCSTGANGGVCRVLAKERVEIPSRSCVLVPVELPKLATLPDKIFINSREDMKADWGGNCEIMPGIISPHDGQAVIGVLNHSEQTTTLHIGQDIGLGHPIEEDTTVELEPELCAASSLNMAKEIPGPELPDHLKEMFDKSVEHLDQGDRSRLAELILKYEDIFAKSSDDLGCTDRVKHTINTGNANPIRQPSRRQPYGKRDIETQEVRKMLEKGIIEPSKSPWSSGIVLVTKRDGSTRFCVDYRRLNDVTVRDAYPIPRTDDCFDALSGSKWFNCMDLCSGFWQIEMDEADKAKTAFSTSQGLYHFRVMPFGLVNAPSTFQRLMEDVLRGLQWKESLLYMDDIITPGKTVDECLERLEHVFQRLRAAHLKLKPSKCVFFQKSAKCLGHIVTEDGVKTDPEKVEVVKDWPTPGNVKHTRSFLGLASYYRRYVKGFSDIARPLHKLCEKNRKFVWTKECQDAFDKLKEALTTTPVLAYPVIGSAFIVDTDASNEGVGAVLSQIQDGGERVIAYMSKSMNKHERSYCITRKELLAVITALKHFHIYLYGQEILVRTDNSAVSWIKTLKVPTGQVARWLQELNTYNITVVHRAGRSHSNADALSRRPCKSCKHQQELQLTFETENEDQEVAALLEEVRAVTRGQAVNKQSSELTNNQVLLDGWDPVEIGTSQDGDPGIGRIKVALESDQPRPNWSDISAEMSELKTLWRQWDRLEIRAGMMYRKFDEGGEILYQLVTPKDRQEAVIKYHHDLPSSGHLGVDKTLSKLQQAFYWPGMVDSVRKYCNQCDDCVAHKISRASNKAPLGQYLVGEPMERVMMDILGPLPVTSRGNRYILVIADWFTKWTECIAIPDQETKTVAQALLDNFISRYGTPLQLYSDQGRCFESKLMEELCELLGIEKTHATSMRPQANGFVERINRTLISMLKCFCKSNQYNWDLYLQQLTMAYRSSPQSSTKVTPNKMVLGREIVLPIQAVIGRPRAEAGEVDVDRFVDSLQDKLKECHEIARKNVKSAANYQKKHYDTNSRKQSFRTGQLVWLHDPTRKVGVSSKLVNKWKGPFVITKAMDDLICMVKRTPSGSPKAYHVDRLYPYRGNKVPVWITRELGHITRASQG